MKRRNFILLSALGISGACIPLLSWLNTYYPAWANQVAHPDTLCRLLDWKTIYSLGDAYLHQHPGESSIKLLLNNLTCEHSAESKKMLKYQLLNKIEEQVKLDFNSGNVIVLEGWVLARTEARQCALFFLMDQ